MGVVDRALGHGLITYPNVLLMHIADQPIAWPRRPCRPSKGETVVTRRPDSTLAPMLRCVEALIFDIEGVVLNTEVLWDKAQVTLLKRRGRVYHRSLIKPLLTGLDAHQSMVIIRRHYNLRDPIDELIDERRQLFRDSGHGEVTFLQGFQEAFSHFLLRFPTALASSMDPILLNESTVALGLDRFAPGGIHSVANGCRPKPHPDLFLSAAESLSVRPRQCLVIEDSPSGIAAAREAGMLTVGLGTTHHSAELKEGHFVTPNWQSMLRHLEGNLVPFPVHRLRRDVGSAAASY